MSASFAEAICELMHKIESSKKILKDFPNFDGEGVRDSALRHCLLRTVDLAEGCILATEKRLPQTLAAAHRSLYETFIRARWVSLSDENAEKFREAGPNLMQNTMRKILLKDYAKITSTLEAVTNIEEAKLVVHQGRRQG